MKGWLPFRLKFKKWANSVRNSRRDGLRRCPDQQTDGSGGRRRSRRRLRVTVMWLLFLITAAFFMKVYRIMLEKNGVILRAFEDGLVGGGRIVATQQARE
jgi:hypothetical protein